MPEIFYRDQVGEKGLSQGDVLRRTDSLNEVLKRYHSYFNQQGDYRYFIVLTQSCDLAIRPDTERCGSRYITIAAVRPLHRAIERYSDKLLYNKLERALGMIPENRKQKINDFLERLINNNEPDYFFLPASPERGIAEHCCAFLKLSIALKVEHYEMLVNARVVGLNPQYQYKLGYLVGNAYSRVATEDLLPDVITKRDVSNIARAFLESGASIEPIKNDIYSILKKRFEKDPDAFASVESKEKMLEDIENFIKQDKEVKKKAISDAIKQSARGMVEDQKLERLALQIMNNPVLLAYFNPK
ncbi:MAG: hypothetical protein ACK4SX_08405 [Alcanivoracaceae bacterium]